MPRIRKKTTRRATTRDRAKVTRKVAETHRKRRKEAKKDVTWKSKKKADPGVPNSFPFKDQVLAEMAEEKRKDAEANSARREAAKAKIDRSEEDTPGIASLHSSLVLTASAPLTASASINAAEGSPEADIPELVDTALATLQDAVDRADVVLQVVDARDIQGGRSAWLEKLVKDAGGRYALVINKIDLVPRESLQAWLSHLPSETYLFSSSNSTSTAGPSSSTALPALGRSELFSAFRKWEKSTTSDEPLAIALMGLPSVGKTAMLNSLLPPTASRHTVAASVPPVASAKHPQPTTTAPVEVALDLGQGIMVHVIDTPGWEYAPDGDDEEAMDQQEEDDVEINESRWDKLEETITSDLLRRNLGRVDRVKDVFPLVNYIIKRSNAQDLMLAYNIPFFHEGDVETFLLSLARANGRVRKHGDADMDAAARILLRDWALNAFPYYSTPPPFKRDASDSDMASRADMTAVLEQCRSRKEMRAKGKGLVRFRGGDVDPREIVLDDDYTAMAEPSDEGDDDEKDDEIEDEDEEHLILGEEDGEELDLPNGAGPSSGSDLVDGEDTKEEEEVEAPISSILKRKRKVDMSPVAHTKKKRVSFGGKAGKGGAKRGRR